MDFYLNDDNVTNRLLKEWKDYGKIIIGVDYDDTIFDYHNKGRKYTDVINLLRECKQIGCYIIVFTCCTEDKYESIRKYMNENNIPFDKINEDMEFIQFKGRKIYTNILLDDRAGLKSAYQYLLKAKNTIKNNLN